MRRRIGDLLTVLLVVLFSAGNQIFAQTANDKDNWNMETAERWYKSGIWRNGMKLEIDESVNIVEFARQYNRNKEYWDKAFTWLRETNLDIVSPGKHILDGDNVFIMASEAATKDFKDTKWEAHKKYIDIQYVVKGEEKMGIGPLAEAAPVEAYNDSRDVAFFSINDDYCKFPVARPGTLLIFFPADVHRPGIKTGTCERTSKIVIKIRVDSLTYPARVNVGLDNWFNNETNRATGLPFHYLWSDTAMSGYSRWGKIFQSKGAILSTIKRPVPSELSGLDIYIIVDPDTTSENPSPNYIMAEDINSIEAWVKNEGVLIVLANDAPNCEFKHLNQLTGLFGITFNHVTLHSVIGKNWDMGAFTSLPDHPLFKGVRKIFMKEISSLNLSSCAIPVLSENGNVYIAESKYGKGTVIAVGDPWIYNEYIDHDNLPDDFDNRKAAENLTGYLLLHARKKME